MAHFAELDGDNKVIRVCVVDDAHVPSDKHADGETWCVNFWGGTWKQTSYNNTFRKQYAGIGDAYDAAKDKFISPQPFPSWALDGSDDWQAPITKPDDGKHYKWNETLYQSNNSKGWEEWTPEE
jgi:hypothetical protein